MRTSQITAICTAAVLIAALVVGAVVYSARQDTLRRENCVSHGGTWVNGQCVNPIGQMTGGA